MSVDRDEPCPCGSGRNHKHCCRLERASAHGRRSGGGEAPVWQADVFSVPPWFADEPEERPVVVAVVAGAHRLYIEVPGRLGGEVDDVAAALEDAVLEAAEAASATPEAVEVRHEEVAAVLADRLADRHVRVRVASRLADVEAHGRAMFRGALDYDAPCWPPISTVVMWAAWGHPDDAIAEVFRAAAAFYRAEPWRHLPEPPIVDVSIPGRGEWLAVVAGDRFGYDRLVLYGDPNDFDGIGRPISLAKRFSGPLLSLSFLPVSELSWPTRKEMSRKGWEVASPSAYPYLVVVNTPGGGLASRNLADLTAALGGVAGLAERLAVGADFSGSEWRDSETGANVVAHERREP